MTEYVRLDNVCEIIMGQSPPSDSYNEDGEGLPFYQGKADFGIIYPSPRVYCTSSKKIVGKNTILLSVRAPVGSVNIANGKCCIGRGLAGIIAKGELIDTMYLYYYFKAREKLIADMGSGSTFKSITKTQVHSLITPLPPLSEQKRIAAALDTMSSVISRRKRQIALLDEAAKSLFVEMFGDEDSINRWNTKPLGDVAKIKVGVVIKPAQYYTTKELGVKTFRSLNVGEFKIKDDNWVYFSKEGHEKNAKSELKEGDVLVVRSGNPGTACIVTNEYAGCNAVDLIIATTNKDVLTPEFLCAFTNLPHGKNQIEHGRYGAAQQHFNVSSYKKLIISLPPIELQNLFAARIEALEAERASCERGLKQMETAFAAMMQEYFG